MKGETRRKSEEMWVNLNKIVVNSNNFNNNIINNTYYIYLKEVTQNLTVLKSISNTVKILIYDRL